MSTFLIENRMHTIRFWCFKRFELSNFLANLLLLASLIRNTLSSSNISVDIDVNIQVLLNLLQKVRSDNLQIFILILKRIFMCVHYFPNCIMLFPHSSHDLKYLVFLSLNCVQFSCSKDRCHILS